MIHGEGHTSVGVSHGPVGCADAAVQQFRPLLNTQSSTEITTGDGTFLQEGIPQCLCRNSCCCPCLAAVAVAAAVAAAAAILCAQLS